MLPTPLALLGPIGTPEMIVIGIVGLLIFGRRLPEVGKSLGKGIVEFKKGLSGIEDELSADQKAVSGGHTSVTVDNQRPIPSLEKEPSSAPATEEQPAAATRHPA
ncbi:Sec-independent protein translocase subunit TatA/TatB [Phycisphaera mikurensis]|uniref:Sec-independent protein translocase protein TatA n=1 Tax=Phycisphaera mikurensis (strain NBRC 102666 / KCTC 22515 / FYK2301M01) TaxID=1142394 RepID=I0IGP4_PHYMF|nr:twin-arginine translocase TatA/TatE family subunit [Phycisphaera mikurensis]MBB6443223.1 sec-independent protein translocase protein TatA [Phycisphaera mikurensis]BAM04432.1 putative Sec-independent translocation protein [Phycisphaera mikurensis NBRC 102666]